MAATTSWPARNSRPTGESTDLWMTAVLRPVGELSGAALDQFTAQLTNVATTSNLVVVNLVSATVPDPGLLARSLRTPGEALSAPDRCLLLVGAEPDLLEALDRCGGDIATVAPDTRKHGHSEGVRSLANAGR